MQFDVRLDQAACGGRGAMRSNVGTNFQLASISVSYHGVYPVASHSFMLSIDNTNIYSFVTRNVACRTSR